MRKDGFENLALTGHILGNRSRGKQKVTYLSSLSDWITEQGGKWLLKKRDLLRATKDRKSWRIMIAKVMRGHGI